MCNQINEFTSMFNTDTVKPKKGKCLSCTSKQRRDSMIKSIMHEQYAHKCLNSNHFVIKVLLLNQYDIPITNDDIEFIMTKMVRYQLKEQIHYHYVQQHEFIIK